jgi:heme/copper-type cytochrome/quinol oxidase subunit 4
MIRRLLLGSVGLAAACLAVAHAWAGAWPWAALSLGLGALWLVGEARGWSPSAPLGFGASVALAVLSLWTSREAGVSSLALLAVVAALCAWDLDGMAQRLACFGYLGDPSRLERQHLGRLLAVAALGLLLGGSALAVQIEITFLPALLLSLLAVLGLSWAVSLLRAEDGREAGDLKQ